VVVGVVALVTVGGDVGGASADRSSDRLRASSAESFSRFLNATAAPATRASPAAPLPRAPVARLLVFVPRPGSTPARRSRPLLVVDLCAGRRPKLTAGLWTTRRAGAAMRRVEAS
jgi:hypothetical protein